MTDSGINIAPNTPVLIGVAAVQQKLDTFEGALEPIALMELALRNAALDCESAASPGAAILAQADEIIVPKGLWEYSDPAGLLAQALSASSAHTVLGDIGVSQQTLINRACGRIMSGEARVVLVAGAESKYTGLLALKAGATITDTQQKDVHSDTVLQPDSELWSEVESATGLGMPVGYFAIIDSALRYKQGLSVDQHRDQMAAMYARFSEIAAENPDAWVDEPVAESFIRQASPGNRMLAYPYTKLHNSQWNVDQGAGLIFCSAAVAESLGVPRRKWIFPRASTESNFMSVASARQDLGGSLGFAMAGEAAMKLAGVRFDDIRLRELYSCFPGAIRVQMAEFGMRNEGDLSVTGGMTFGGGPLNNFVLQATVKMTQLLRDQPNEVGLITTVSGMLTKQACALWSGVPNPKGWGFADVTDQVREQTVLLELVANYTGLGTVAGYTVLYKGDSPWRAVAVFDLPNEQRTAAFSECADVIAAMTSQECCGLEYHLDGGQFSSTTESVMVE